MFWFMVVLFIIIVFLILVIIIDSNRFKIKKYQIDSNKIKKEVKIVLLADLHNKSYGTHNKRLVKAIEKQKPDFILIAGDMITAKAGKSFEQTICFLDQLSKTYPIYYGNGNHEYRLKLYKKTYGSMHEKYTEELLKRKIVLLQNEHEYLSQYHIDICGSEIDRAYYKRFRKNKMDTTYLTGLLGVASKDAFQILIAHNPEYFEEYAKWGADLVVSGHVHGGVIRVPFLGGVISPSLQLFPKYYGGLYQQGNSSMILSRGLGMHTIPIRMFNPGELSVITLHQSEK